MNQTTFIVILIAAGIVALVASFSSRKNRSRRPAARYRMEADLLRRETIIDNLQVHDLPTTDLHRFSNSWRAVQARYGEAPRRAIVEADHLVREAMGKSGYPISDFDQRAVFLSLDHPQVVENYRLAHAIAVKAGVGHATAGELRQAMVHFRYLFEDLLNTRSAQRMEEVRM